MASYNRYTLDTSQQLTDNYIMTSHNQHTPNASRLNHIVTSWDLSPTSATKHRIEVSLSVKYRTLTIA